MRPGRPSRRPPRGPPPPPPPRSRPPPCSPLLTSSPGGSALPPQGQISAAHSPRGGTQEPQPCTPSPPASPCVPESARDSPSRAAVLRSNQAALAPLSSALLYLPHSLPRSLAPAYLLISPGCLPRLVHPPSPPTSGWGQTTHQSEEGACTFSPPPASSPAHNGSK